MVHGSIPLPFRRSRSLRHRRRFPNSNLSPARPLSGTIPAAQSAKTKETESKDEKPLHRRGGAGNDLPKIGPDIRNILRSSCFGRRPRASKNHKKRRKRHRTGSETIRERKTSPKPIRRPPTSRRIRRRAARTYDRTVRRPRHDCTAAGRGNPSRIRPSAVFAPFRQSNHSMQRQGGRQCPSSSASAAIVATP